MPAPPYHGGHSLADIISDFYRHFRSLPRRRKDALAEHLANGETSPPLLPSWYLEWVSLLEEGDGWARSSRRIMIVVDGKQRDTSEFCYGPSPSEPRLPDLPEPPVEQVPSQPDTDPP